MFGGELHPQFIHGQLRKDLLNQPDEAFLRIALRACTGDELQLAMARAGLEPAMRETILSENRRRLESLAGASANVCCIVQSAEEGDESEAFPGRAVRNAA